MCLCLLADAWARARGGDVSALTVDHGLRPTAAAEARQVAVWLRARGIAHHVMPWTGAKPETSIQETAREARYRLLAGWCRAAGILHLLVAHHRDDQAETVALRQSRSSGADGLAGMAAVRELAGSVTAQDVAEALGRAGHQVDRRRIELDHPIKSLGDHLVSIRLHSEVHAEVRVSVVPE